MKDPQRLLDEGATELELLLLRAGDAEGPSASARRAAASSLGISVAVTSATSGAAAAGGKSLAPAAQMFATKWWVIGALVSLGAGAGYSALTAKQAPPGRAPAVPAATQVARQEPPLPLPSDAPGIVPESPAVAPDRAPVSAPRGVPSAPVGLQEQVALIDRARSAAASGQAVAALAALDEYDRRFPRGVFQQDATMLRIEALLARGDKASAARLGRKFLERYPGSAFAERVKTLTKPVLPSSTPQ